MMLGCVENCSQNIVSIKTQTTSHTFTIKCRPTGAKIEGGDLFYTPQNFRKSIHTAEPPVMEPPIGRQIPVTYKHFTSLLIHSFLVNLCLLNGISSSNATYYLIIILHKMVYIFSLQLLVVIVVG